MKTMSRALLVAMLSTAIPLAPAWGGSKVGKECTYKGIKLWGKVQVVDRYPDLKVETVGNFADLRVQRVESFPGKCGQWQFVTQYPDFKIQFVTSYSDIKITNVSSFPGVP